MTNLPKLFCMVCHREVDSLEVDLREEGHPDGTPGPPTVTVTVRCHGEVWRRTGYDVAAR